jgi:hypothetical protein
MDDIDSIIDEGYNLVAEAGCDWTTLDLPGHDIIRLETPSPKGLVFVDILVEIRYLNSTLAEILKNLDPIYQFSLISF